MFRISPDKVSREAKKVPNTVSASSRTKPITVSQPSVITKKGMNSNLNGLSSTGLDNTKTKRLQSRSNIKNDRVPSASKSSQNKNKEVKVEEHHRNLLLSKKNKHSSSACNNSKIDSQDVISKVVCAMCKKCLISVNHDECLVNYVNGKNSRGKKQKDKVIQICLWYVDSGWSKHMTGNLKLLINFVWKFMGTVRIRNDHVAAILGFDIGKLGAKGDIGFFIRYFADSCAFRIYNRQTKKIIKTMNVSFDELSAMAFEQRSSKPGLQCMTSGQISS
nr:integrase, catalytic region, zinc finger, CCHC-type, peptidase aspartic, catalytic [Tanacetum cinerariifolium]